MNRWTACLCLIAMLGMICHTASAQPAPKTPATQAGPIDMQRAFQLFQRRQRGERLTPDENAYVERALAERARQGGGGGGQQPSRTPQSTTKQKPLTEMSASDRYKNQDGGLYGKGQNTPPEPHRQASAKASAQIQPLDANGKPSTSDGRVVLVSISMSNATQEFSMFKRIADNESRKSARTTVVDCAQGGQTMERWAQAEAQPWTVAEDRIRNAGCTPAQVQVAWVKLANGGPRGELEDHGRKLERDTIATLQNAKTRYPNLKIAYLSSRTYGGYAVGQLNPEPYAYEGAFVTRWVVQDQINGQPELNFDSAKGTVRAPLLLWGPYLWGDGVTPRTADKLVWNAEDFVNDGVHPSDSGRQKVASLLLNFFLTDPTAKPWFTGVQ